MLLYRFLKRHPSVCSDFRPMLLAMDSAHIEFDEALSKKYKWNIDSLSCLIHWSPISLLPQQLALSKRVTQSCAFGSLAQNQLGWNWAWSVYLYISHIQVIHQRKLHATHPTITPSSSDAQRGVMCLPTSLQPQIYFLQTALWPPSSHAPLWHATLQ